MKKKKKKEINLLSLTRSICTSGLITDTYLFPRRRWRYFEVTQERAHLLSLVTDASPAPRERGFALFHHTKQRWCLYSDIFFFFSFSRIPLLLSHCISAHNWDSHECGIASRLDVVKKRKKKMEAVSREWIMTDGQGGDAGKSKGARVRSHAISTSAAHRRWCNNNITHLISSAYFVSPAAATAPSLHIYHIHLIFRNKCSRKRIMHLLYAAFITDTFTWGFAFMVSNGALFTGVPHICRDRGWGCECVGGGSSSLHISAISER